MKDLGWRMSLIQSGNKLPVWGMNYYDLIMSMGEETCDRDCWKMCLEAVVNDLDRWDFVHSANTPDGYSKFLTTISKIPVIHDCHDAMTTFRHTEASAGMTEYIVNQRADGLLFVSEGQRDYICDTHDVDRSKTYVYPNYALGKYISKYPHTKLSEITGEIHLVYEGGIFLGGENPSWAHHRNIWKLIKMLAKQGINVHIYSGQGLDISKGQYLSIQSPVVHWHGATSLSTLMREMTKYDAGIVAFDRTYEEFIDHALPNKLFEYMAAGLPVLSDDAAAVVDWLETYNVGEPLFANWHDGDIDTVSFKNIDPYIDSVAKQNMQWTTEANIGGLEKFYEKVARRGR
jgi:hypothetical protein